MNKFLCPLLDTPITLFGGTVPGCFLNSQTSIRNHGV